MQCSIYALHEMKTKLRMEKREIRVLARYRGMLILLRDEEKSLWMLPCGARKKGEDGVKAACRVLSEALGEAEFDLGALCGYGVTGEDGKEHGGMAYVADVREWPGEIGSRSRAFARLPLSSQMADAALALGLYKWSGDFFDERLQLSRLGAITSF